MVFFINFLRALAACLITNSHYTGIYPIDALANGGMTGNMIFCAVSGYCLYNIRTTFPRWYGKRLIRCYPSVWIITLIYLLVGAYTLSKHGVLGWFLYPTGYHFIASIVVLYIPFYFILRYLPKHLPRIMLGIALGYGIWYICFVDKTAFQILDVRSVPYRALLMESMLLGAWFREHDQRFRNRFKWIYAAGAVLLTGTDLVIRFLMNRFPALCPFQLLSPAILLAQLYCIFRVIAGLDARLCSLPKGVKHCIDFLSNHTLEIYLVQGPLIELLRPLTGFPANWLMITASILMAAWLLRLLCKLVMKPIPTFA